MEPEISLPSSQVHFLSQVNPVDEHPSYLFKIHFNISISSIPIVSKWPISCTFSNQNLSRIFLSPKCETFLHLLIFPNMIGLIIFGENRCYIIFSTFLLLSPTKILFMCSTQARWGGRCMWNDSGRWEVSIQALIGILNRGHGLKNSVVWSLKI